MTRTFRWLAEHGNLASADAKSFAADAAQFLAELNAGHPFREGNGRTQLTFLRLLTSNAGHRFNGAALEPQRTLSAMVDSFSGDLEPLKNLIADIIA
jgi:cell filamentation protein